MIRKKYHGRTDQQPESVSIAAPGAHDDERRNEGDDIQERRDVLAKWSLELLEDILLCTVTRSLECCRHFECCRPGAICKG